MYTCINSRDNITNTYETLAGAFAMASNCYDGAGIVCTILDHEGNEIAYSFTPSGRATTS